MITAYILRAVTNILMCRNHMSAYSCSKSARLERSIRVLLLNLEDNISHRPSSPFSLAIQLLHSITACSFLHDRGLMHFAATASKGVEPTDHCRSQWWSCICWLVKYKGSISYISSPASWHKRDICLLVGSIIHALFPENTKLSHPLYTQT